MGDHHILILICATVKPHQSLSVMQGGLTLLNTYVIVRGHDMNSPWSSTVDATDLNFHSGARLVTRQNNASCHAKSWSACSIQKQHMHASRASKLWEELYRQSQSQSTAAAGCWTLENVSWMNAEWHLCTLLCTVFFGDDENRNRETTCLTIFTLVFREVRYILPRVPYPAQANEHLSQPPSACIISKLDFTAKETFTAALPPLRVLNGCTQWFAAAKCSR